MSRLHELEKKWRVAHWLARRAGGDSKTRAARKIGTSQKTLSSWCARFGFSRKDFRTEVVYLGNIFVLTKDFSSVLSGELTDLETIWLREKLLGMFSEMSPQIRALASELLKSEAAKQ